VEYGDKELESKESQIEDSPMFPIENDELEERWNGDEGTKEFARMVIKYDEKSKRELLKEVIEILNKDSFSIKHFREKIKSISNCREVIKEELDKKMESDGFEKSEVKLTKDGHITKTSFFKKNVIAVLRKQVELCMNQNFKVTIEKDIVQEEGKDDGEEHPTNTLFFRNINRMKRASVMKCPEMEVIWYENGECKSFTGLCQVFTDKTASSLNAKAMTAHAVHLTLLNFDKRFREWLINHGHTIIGFLPTKMNAVDFVEDDCKGAIDTDENEHIPNGSATDYVIPLNDRLEMTSNNNGRLQKMNVIHSVMKDILSPLTETNKIGFKCETKDGRKYYCHPIICSYCCDIPEGKDLSGIRHNTNTKYPCIRCLSSLNDIRNNRTGKERTVEQMNVILEQVQMLMQNGKSNGKTKKQTEKLLKEWSLSEYNSVLVELYLENEMFILPGLYTIFTFEMLHNLHLGLSKLLKRSVYNYISSRRVVRMSLLTGNKERVIGSMKNQILKACNSILRDIQENNHTPGLHFDFSTKDCSKQLNGIFTNDGLKGMLEGKDYRNLDYVFPFVTAFIDKITGQNNNPELTEINIIYTDIVNELTRPIQKVNLQQKCDKLRKKIKKWKDLYKAFFEKYCDEGLFTLKYHLMDHLVDDLEKYTDLSFIASSPYEYFNTWIKNGYRETSKRIDSALEETVKVLDHTIRSYKKEFDFKASRFEKRGMEQKLSKSVGKCSLMQLKQINTKSTENVNIANNEVPDVIMALTDEERNILTSLIEDELRKEEVKWMDSEVQLEISNSAYVDHTKIPTLEDYDMEKNKVLFKENLNQKEGLVRIVASNSFGPNKKKTNSFIYMKGQDESSVEEFWFAQCRVLLSIQSKGNNFHKEYVFVRFMITTPPLDKVDKALGCINLRWETEDGIDYTVRDNCSRRSDVIVSGENYGLVEFQSVCGDMQLIRANYAISPFCKELPWTHHRFYVNRFLRD